MGLTVIPTNIGGVSLNSLASPLASLLGGTTSAQVMSFPSDLGSNPSMGHAVIFQAYDYKTELGNSLATVGQTLITAYNQASTLTTEGLQAATTTVGGLFSGGLSSTAGQVGLGSITASQYKPLTKGSPLATISLFMPETMAIQYHADWSEVSLTEELGLLGMGANAYADSKGQPLKDAVTPYAIYAASKALGDLTGAKGATALTSQALGVGMMNPQTQLLYKGTSLREFTLSFTLTPKTSAEAQTVKNICDSFAYFTLPGLSGAQGGSAGQFFIPPQVFSVQFQFLGGSGIGNQISNAISSALNSTGLNVLTNALGGSSTITGGTPSKTFTVNDCVLTDVQIDYAPNGWATYNDGYPVQTVINLSFRETTVYTKNQMAATQVAANYNNPQQIQQYGEMGAAGLQEAATPMAGGIGWVNGGG